MIETLVQDVRFALRVLMRDRGFALTAIVVLGVGLGVNNMFFTLVYAHKFRGVPIEQVDRVLFISTFDDRVRQSRDFRSRNSTTCGRRKRASSGLGAYVNGVATVGDRDRAPDRFDATYFTAGHVRVARPSRRRWAGCRRRTTIGPAIRPWCCSAPKRGGFATRTIRRFSAAPSSSTALRSR